MYATYTMVNTVDGRVYSGRTSITVPETTPDRTAGIEAVRRREANHHVNGYGPAQLDVATKDKMAIRGREQQLIDYFGGAKSMGGTSGNAINGIWDYNPMRDLYMYQANFHWGTLPSNRP